ncbi:MAG: chorismate mutase/prephenate dehydratase [Pseudohongiellaceae bacterium]
MNKDYPVVSSSPPIKVSYLGPIGTFTQLAANVYFTAGCEFMPCATIDDVFLAVEKKLSDFGVVPVENSTEGAVNNTQDCLIDSQAVIVGEVVVPIEHHLLVNKELGDLAQIEVIASHKQSLAQCRNWLRTKFPNTQLLEVSSNAEAARLAAENTCTASIAGSLAAELYGLRTAHSAIQDKSNNSTRFLVLADNARRTLPSDADKTSVLIYTHNKPGALFRILQPFEELGISLSKIETRPSKIEAWEYVFFIDFDGHAEDPLVIELFARLEKATAEIKLLGSYAKFVSKH